LVDLLVGEALENLSVSLARPNDGITGPALQRSDGTSVYTVAGSGLFTSTRILQAEQRLVETAGRYDGHAISLAAVDVALLQATANGVALNADPANGRDRADRPRYLQVLRRLPLVGPPSRTYGWGAQASTCNGRTTSNSYRREAVNCSDHILRKLDASGAPLKSRIGIRTLYQCAPLAALFRSGV
jgi:hypothetical protein